MRDTEKAIIGLLIAAVFTSLVISCHNWLLSSLTQN